MKFTAEQGRTSGNVEMGDAKKKKKKIERLTRNLIIQPLKLRIIFFFWALFQSLARSHSMPIAMSVVFFSIFLGGLSHIDGERVLAIYFKNHFTSTKQNKNGTVIFFKCFLPGWNGSISNEANKSIEIDLIFCCVHISWTGLSVKRTKSV